MAEAIVKAEAPDKRAAARERRKEKLNKRITELDILRFVAIVLMVFDHLMYDVFAFMPSIFGRYTDEFWKAFAVFARGYWNLPLRKIVRYFVLFIFLGLSGVSCSFSRSNLKRGLKLMALAIALTVGTIVVDEVADLNGSMTIVFGIIHMIALSLILVALVDKLTEKMKDNKWVFLAIGAALILAQFLIRSPYERLTEVYVGSDDFFKLFFNAFIGKLLLGPDCYSFLYYGGQVFVGVFLGKLLYPERKPLIFKKGYRDNFMTFLGRHTLIVYAAHQVLIPVILGVILLLCGYQFKM